MGDSGYLSEAISPISELLGSVPVRIAFIGFADASNQYEQYASMVRTALQALPHELLTVLPANAADTIRAADAIMIGGGNSFKLLHDLQQLQLLEPVREKVRAGTPYIGWSAGSNMLCPGLYTTNDMPVIEPASFKALQLLPFQVNPHYNNALPAGHRGETRDQRLQEFVQLNPALPVLALPEGTGIRVQDGRIELFGSLPAFIFSMGADGRIEKNEWTAGAPAPPAISPASR